MPETIITTVRHLKAAISSADLVLIQPRFGTSEAWLKISKVEANRLANGLAANATPESTEMFSGMFGTLNGKTLYLG